MSEPRPEHVAGLRHRSSDRIVESHRRDRWIARRSREVEPPRFPPRDQYLAAGERGAGVARVGEIRQRGVPPRAQEAAPHGSGDQHRGDFDPVAACDAALKVNRQPAQRGDVRYGHPRHPPACGVNEAAPGHANRRHQHQGPGERSDAESVGDCIRRSGAADRSTDLDRKPLSIRAAACEPDHAGMFVGLALGRKAGGRQKERDQEEEWIFHRGAFPGPRSWEYSHVSDPGATEQHGRIDGMRRSASLSMG